MPAIPKCVCCAQAQSLNEIHTDPAMQAHLQQTSRLLGSRLGRQFATRDERILTPQVTNYSILMLLVSSSNFSVRFIFTVNRTLLSRLWSPFLLFGFYRSAQSTIVIVFVCTSLNSAYPNLSRFSHTRTQLEMPSL